jgi:hypothetical protein
MAARMNSGFIGEILTTDGHGLNTDFFQRRNLAPNHIRDSAKEIKITMMIAVKNVKAKPGA